jgi:hypothetical protein
MVHLKTAGVMLSALMLFVASDAAAQSQALADFKSLCINTHAAPSPAFAAADAAG